MVLNMKWIPAGALMGFSLLLAPPAVADGLFGALKLNRAQVEAERSAQPGLVDATRTRPAYVIGYQRPSGVEFAVEHWQGSTGIAGCRAGVLCLDVAIPTRGRFTSATIGYEIRPAASDFAFGVRGGAEYGRLSFGSGSSVSRTSVIAGVTGRYYMTDRLALGLDVSASGFDTRTYGLELRAKF